MSVDAPFSAVRDGGATARRSAGPLALAFLRQLVYEHLVLARRGIRFRSRDERAVRAAYTAMSEDQFEGINARQRWANWRTIPANLRDHVNGRPFAAVDLCCGAGHSTEVLAHVLPPGSRILGLDLSPGLIGAACRRGYRDAAGGLADVRFRVQSVLEPFREPDGTLVPEASLDLVHSSGAVGSHFEPDATRRLLEETRRVLRPGGFALVDAGRGGTSPPRLEELLAAAGFVVCRRSRSCFVDRSWQKFVPSWSWLEAPFCPSLSMRLPNRNSLTRSSLGIGDHVRFSNQRFVMWIALPGWAATLFTSTLPYVNVERSLASQRLSYPRYQAKTGSASIVFVPGSRACARRTTTPRSS
jgi:SAM-dependent methyltransferase